MNKTMYPEINHLLDELISRQREILNEKLISIYLYGSLVTGDFDPKISDIDLLCVLSSDIKEEDFEKLKVMHEDFAKLHKNWNDRIEAQYLSKKGLKTFKIQKSKMADISPGEPFHIVDAGQDWLVNWYVVQEKGKVLFGPPPSIIIDHITKKEFIDTVKNHAKSWKEWVKHIPKRRGSQAYAIITLCRAYYSISNGEQVSKLKAAEWMKEKFPEWTSLIDKALVWREEQWINQVEDESIYKQTVEFVNVISEKIKSLN